MILTRDEEPIIALCTPEGKGALALLRVSGRGAIEVLKSMVSLADGRALIDVATHTINLGWVIQNDQHRIDQVMFLVMYGPKTFTGQDTVEITCHNNVFIIENIIQRALECGVRLAQHGEFSRRSFLNNKIDLVQAEAINELINASGQRALHYSLAQVTGSFSQWIAALEKKLVTSLAFSEASFEFIDESMEFGETIRTTIQDVLGTISRLKNSFNQQKQIRQGFKIVLLGSVNVGKSSLFNALLDEKRSIVTPIAGTTRDSIEAAFYKDGIFLTLVDTAGLRQASDIIEQEGIERSCKEAEKADLILLMYDYARLLNKQEEAIYTQMYNQYYNKIIVVANKIDLPAAVQQLPWMSNAYGVSSAARLGLAALQEGIMKKIQSTFENLDSPFLLNKRHFSVLVTLEEHMLKILAMLENPIPYELISLHLQQALECLTELSGKTISEQGIDAVFREFCVGK